MPESLGAHAAATGLRVVRDGRFSSLGLLSHQGPEMLVYVESPEWIPRLAEHPTVTAVITTPALAGEVTEGLALTLSDNPKQAFYDLHERLLRETDFYGRNEPTRIAASAAVDARAVVAPENIVIGEGVVIEPFVVLRGRVTIEDNAVIRAGCVIGSDGFQVVVRPPHAPRRIAHAGAVRIRSGAEVRAHCCIDRGLFAGATTVGDDATLDHLVYVAHDVSLGAQCRVGAGAVINGTVRVGERSWIGPGATLTDGITVGRDAHVSLGSVVTRDVAEGQQVSGNFAVAHDRFLKWLRSVR